MTTVGDVMQALERIAPARNAFAWDKVGLHVGASDWPVGKALVALDHSTGAIAHAIAEGCDFMLTHHPLIFQSIARLSDADPIAAKVLRLAAAKVGLASAHTNWDASIGGVNDTLAGILELQEVRHFGEAAAIERLKVVTMVPTENASAVIDALSAVGAGEIGLYRRCAFVGPGIGKFEPLIGSNPAIGAVGRTEEVAEVRVEMELHAELRAEAEEALRRAHPYEEPIVDFYPLTPKPAMKLGRIGVLKSPMSLAEYHMSVERLLGVSAWCWGEPSSRVSSVAVIGGGADDCWGDAKAAGADVYLTGEARQHVALASVEAGMPIIAAGHYATEHPGCVTLCRLMAEAIPDIEWRVYEPQPGTDGRPLNS